MKLVNLIYCNLKRMMKNKTSLLLSFVMPAVVILGMGFLMNKAPEGSKTYYMVNSDQGSYGEELQKELSKNYSIKLYTKEEAQESLKKKRIAEYYEITEDFSKVLMGGQKPSIMVNRRESQQSFSDFQITADSYINKLMAIVQIETVSGEKVDLGELQKDGADIKIVSTKKTNMASQMTINLLISFNLFVSIGMCYELFALKSEKTLRRALTTGNKPSGVIGAVLGAQYIIVIISYIILFFVNATLNDRGLLEQAPIIILNLAMTTAVALSLAVFVSRVVKNEKLIVIVLQIILCGTCFIGGSFMPIELLPKGITFLSKFTPQYWAIESIKTLRYEYSLIVLLFAVLLFTAGTVSAKSFAEAN